MGVESQGDSVVKYMDQTVPDEKLDAGFILGYTLENNFRRRLIDWLKKRNVPTVFVDSNILHYARSEHEWHRYSVNGVYPDTAQYFFGDIDPNKWHTYSSWHSTTLKPWRTAGRHILVLAQRPHGWNMQGVDQSQWLDSVITSIQRHSGRHIRIRMHPGDGKRDTEIKRLQHRWGRAVQISHALNIRDDLANCWSSVGYNSTPTAVSVIEGVPVYVADPVRSWAQGVCYNNIAEIENPPCPDRSQWVNRIANIHWSNQEVRQGRLWTAIKHSISSVPV